MKPEDRMKLQKELEREMEPFRKVARQRLNNRVWMRDMRRALGVPASEIAYRLKVSRAWVYRVEGDEQAGWVGFEDLDDIAAAMNCRLVYGFVPFRDQTLEETARDLKENPRRQSPRAVAERQRKAQKVEERIQKVHEKLMWKREADRAAAKARKEVMARAAAQAAKRAAAPEPAAPPMPRTAEEMRRQGVDPVEALRAALTELKAREQAAGSPGER